jgi:ribosome-associated protein
MSDSRTVVQITSRIAIDESEIELDFVRASGPGGEKVNRAATAVQLRFDVAGSPSLPADVRQRLVRIAGSRMTKKGVLVIDARRFRTQERNREDAIERLVRLIRTAAEQPKMRRSTRPSQAARLRRLEAKRRRSRTKQLRRPVTCPEE